MSILAIFWKPEACGQTVLPDRSVLIGQKLVENTKIQKLKCDILSNFQTMWICIYVNTKKTITMQSHVVLRFTRSVKNGRGQGGGTRQLTQPKCHEISYTISYALICIDWTIVIVKHIFLLPDVRWNVIMKRLVDLIWTNCWTSSCLCCPKKWF